jgi:hypothetical protein
MAGGELTLKLDPSLAERLERRAAEIGSSPEALAVSMLEQHLFSYDDYQLNEGPRTLALDPEDEAGPTYPAAEILDEFDRRVKERLAANA